MASVPERSEVLHSMARGAGGEARWVFQVPLVTPRPGPLRRAATSLRTAGGPVRAEARAASGTAGLERRERKPPQRPAVTDRDWGRGASGAAAAAVLKNRRGQQPA